MTHLLIIAVMVMTTLRDLAPEPLATSQWILTHKTQALAWSLLPFVVLACVQLLSAATTNNQLGSAGGSKAWQRFEQISAAVRIGALIAYANALLVFGLLDLVRQSLGDYIALDELIVLLLPLGLIALTWASAAPLEARLREALLIRRLDQGLHIPPMPRPVVWWWSTVKQQMLFVAVPVGILLTWSEAIAKLRDALWQEAIARHDQASPLAQLGNRLLDLFSFDAPPSTPASTALSHPTTPHWVSHAPDWLLDEHTILLTTTSLQLLGVIVLLLLMPMALRLLWETQPLGPGALLDRLMGLCRRYRIGVRKILVWRTQGSMINGAIIGFLPRLRYILLTDTLFESLPADQVEAVTAHEVAHAKCRHIPWLAASMLSSAMLVTALASFIMRMAHLPAATDGWAPVVILIAASLISLLIFGWVSRIFEQQADCFAACHLDTHYKHQSDQLNPEADTVIEQHTLAPFGPQTMARALGNVSAINGHPLTKFTWRHGRIKDRQRALIDAIGKPLKHLPANRKARLAKRVVCVLLLVGIGLSILEARAEAQQEGSSAQSRYHQHDRSVNFQQAAQSHLPDRPAP